MLRGRAPRAAVGLLALLLGLSGAAEGSLLRALTVRELQEGADAIVAGTVLSVRSVRTRTLVETVARVRVERSWRGGEQRVVRVRIPGGFHDGRHVVVPGAPRFRRGEKVLLFLYGDGRELRPVGLFQGVWRLDASDPELARASDSGGASLLAAEEGTAAVERAERSVQQLVGRGGAR